MRTRSIPLAHGAVVSTVVALCLLALPAVGHAAVTTFGSNLSGSANLEKARGEDTAYWSTAFASGASPRAPASGQIRAIRLKGTAVKLSRADPDNRIHFQTLRPLADGSLRVILTSQEFRVPFTGDANQVNTFHPVNLCATAGDYVAFNTVGGFNPNGGYPSGTPYRIFSAIGGSSTRQFASSGGTMNGATFPSPPTVTHPNGLNAEHPRTELLMQMELGTGPDAGAACGGGGSGGGSAGDTPRPFYGLLLPRLQTSWVSRRRVALVRTRCESRAVIGCGGTVTLVTKRAFASARRRIKLGSGRFRLRAGASRKVRVKLSRKGARLVRRRRRLAAIARVVAHDAAGRRKTASSTVTLRPGRR